MPTINEAERRRPAFRAEAPVVLADGRTWWLPKPRARFAPDAGPAGFKAVVVLKGDDRYGELYDAALDAERRADEPGQPPFAITAAWLACAAHLLTYNYDLSPDELTSVLQFSLDEEDDPEGYAVREAVMAVVLGRAPKPSGGSTGPS